MNTIYCVYHKDCLDGFASALVVKMFYEKAETRLEFIPTTYGDPVPEFESGSTVIIVDFSYPSDILLKISNTCKILVIDHHISAIRELVNAFALETRSEYTSNKSVTTFQGKVNPQITLELNTGYSGAGLCYRYFFGGLESKPPHRLFQLVEDRDLWRFYYPETRPFNRYLTALGWDFKQWESVVYKPIEEIIPIGSILLKDDEQKIKWHLNNAMEIRDLREVFQSMDLTDTGLTLEDFKSIPLVNVPKYLVSETLNSIIDDYPFAIGYHNGDGERIYRFNASKNNQVDVSVLASRLGGGGHAKAAGWRVKRDGCDIIQGG